MDSISTLSSQEAGSNQQTEDLFFEAVEEESDLAACDDEESFKSSRAWKGCNLWRFREACGWLANNENTQRLILAMICVNGAMMGIATYDIVRKNPRVQVAFDVADLAFLMVFTVELALQLVYRGVFLFANGWLCFDFFIIVVSWTFGSFQIVRAFRVFRTLRMVGRVRALSNVVTALLNVIPRMFYILLLLLNIFYIFSVLFTSLYKDMWQQHLTTQNFFSRLDYTSFTLFQVMCLDDWSQIAREVMATYKSAWFPFVTFVTLTSFMLANLIIAVLCDAIYHMRKLSKNKLIQEHTNPIIQDKIKMQKQIDDISNAITNLSHAQQRTTHMIQYLTRQLQMHTSINHKLPQFS